MRGNRLGMGRGDPQVGRGCGAFLAGAFLFRNNISLFRNKRLLGVLKPKTSKFVGDGIPCTRRLYFIVFPDSLMANQYELRSSMCT